MEKKNVFDLPFILQRLGLLIFALFPVTLSIISQTFLVASSWNFTKLFFLGGLVAVFLTPLFAMFSSKSIGVLIEKFEPLAIFWVIGLAFVLRIVLVQLISTDFVSDFEDIHFVAVDIFSGNTLENLDEYPNIPRAIHLNMPALILSFVYKLFGASTTTAKLFMIVLSVLTTLIVFFVGKEVANTKTGFVTAFLFAVLPSIVCYTGMLAGDHLFLPLMILAVLIFARMQKVHITNLFSLVFGYAILGAIVGLMDWFRPLGPIFLSALIISLLVYYARKWKTLKLAILISTLLITYSLTSNLAITISKSLFQVNTISTSQKMGEYFLVGLNPNSHGKISLEDSTLIGKTHARFKDDNLGAQLYLAQLAISRLDQEQAINLFKDKFTLVWSSHDALFDYSLIGSNDHELVNLLRDFETLLWLIVTIFILFNTVLSIRKKTHPAIFTMQLFILGFAILLIFMEVQNRYVIVIIPFSLLLAAIGMNQLFSRKIKLS
mgnify:CR=1 FL=1